MKKILPFFSYIFHPIFIPVFGTLFYIYKSTTRYETHQNYLLIFQVTLFTILVPISFFFLLKSLGKVDSMMISDLSQRKIPFIVQILLTATLIQKSPEINRQPELCFFFIGGLISTILALILLFAKIKASIHMIGISTLTTFVIAISIHNHNNMVYIILTLIITCGLVASSRLAMKAHTGTELLFGFFTGAFPQLILLNFWL